MEKKNFPGPVNLGNPVEISIMQLAKEITEMVGSKSIVIAGSLHSEPGGMVPGHHASVGCHVAVYLAVRAPAYEGLVKRNI